MATRALTPVAQRRSRDHVSASKAPGPGRDWRQVLLSQDAEAIWRELFTLVRSAMPGHAAEYDQITQQLFLELLASDRFTFYIEQGYSDSEITEDLKSILSG